MKILKYLFFSSIIILTIGILYFPYHLKYRIQTALTKDKAQISALAREIIIYEIPGLKLERLGKDYDGGYIVPIQAIEKSDILLGYGIGNDNSFEDQFSLKYNKQSFGFDCGISNIESKSPLFNFLPHCLGTSDYILENQTSSGQISSFSQQISFLNIMDKTFSLRWI